LQAPEGPWRRIEVLAETGSTNADLLARARMGEAEGLVLVADHQSSGRGRLDRTWTAPPRSAVAVSVLLRPDGVPPERLGWLSLLGALAVTDALRGRRCALPARLKWPNDVLVPDPEDGGELKVCGVLAEAVAPIPGPAGLAESGTADSGIAVVLGAGINVTQTTAELPVPTATSLRLAGSATTDRDTVVRLYLRALAERYASFRLAGGDPRASGIGAAYRELCSTLGREIELHLPGGQAERGTADEVDDDGRLVVRLAGTGEVRAFAAADVVHALPTR
jgi:BirA family biotin operon repressor/biotin-[acetyl-CoA-carboxylase] ligase